ncbi:MAG: hypothetical protein ACOYOS_10480 [Syntrophales bacterium]
MLQKYWTPVFTGVTTFDEVVNEWKFLYLLAGIKMAEMMVFKRQSFFQKAGILALLLLVIACSTSQQQTLRTERDYQIAFNDAYFHGNAKMEVPVKYGRIDLVTSDYVIEVDRLEKFHEAIGQALHYAKETGKKPAIAIFMEEQRDEDKEKLKYVTRLCGYYKIKVWFINEELEKAGRK